MNISKTCFICCLLSQFFGNAAASLAVTKLDFDAGQPLTNQVVRSGKIKVQVSYQPIDLNERVDDNSDINNVSYQIFYNEQLYQQNSEYSAFGSGYVELIDLDNNGIDEIIVSTYSGGAHCCTSLVIYTWQKDKFIREETGFLDGSGGSFEDLDGDNNYEFVTVDNAFLYAFSSYAASFPPSRIYTFQQGKLADVTRKYPQELRKTLAAMLKAFQLAKKEKAEVNGILAGYVAQKILLGEYEEAWQFLLANYDKNSDWGLDIHGQSIALGKYPDFPAALSAFLLKNGYLGSAEKVCWWGQGVGCGV
ncbi:MAG: hypothetical protein PX637_00705, partial [Microcystis sp. M53601_WE4]|nr:hypothetical protein [Microcystis sp. M53601_WE4]